MLYHCWLQMFSCNQQTCFFCNSLFFKNQDFMGKSDPYLEFSRPMLDGKLQAVHRTEVQMCHIVAVQCRLYHACSQFLLIFTYYMISLLTIKQLELISVYLLCSQCTNCTSRIPSIQLVDTCHISQLFHEHNSWWLVQKVRTYLRLPTFILACLSFYSFPQTLQTNLLSAPLVHTSFGTHSCSIAAHPSLQTCTSPDTFRRHLKTHYYQLAF